MSFDFSLGTENDIPTQVDLKGFLIVPFLWVANNNNYQMRFNADGSMHILQYSRINSDVIMTAEGTYTIEGNYAICNLTPSWFGGNAGSFPGWEKGKPCVKKLKIEVVGATSIKVTYEDGTVLTYKHF